MLIEKNRNGAIVVSELIGNHLESRQFIGYSRRDAVAEFRQVTRTVYLNWRGPDGVETVDSLCRIGFDHEANFLAELRRLVAEYRLAGMAVYASRRPCKES